MSSSRAQLSTRSHCTEASHKNVFSEHLTCPYDRLSSFKSEDRSLHISDAEVTNVHFCCEKNCVWLQWLTTSDLVSAARTDVV